MGLLWNTLAAFIAFPSGLREAAACSVEGKTKIPAAPSERSSFVFKTRMHEWSKAG